MVHCTVDDGYTEDSIFNGDEFEEQCEHFKFRPQTLPRRLTSPSTAPSRINGFGGAHVG
jgi:hypothetical protein